MADYASREELDALRGDLRDTERILRDRDDTKQAELRVEFKEEIAVFRAEVSTEFSELKEELKGTASRSDTDEIKKKLSWQNKAWLVPMISTLMLGLLYVFLHYALRIG